MTEEIEAIARRLVVGHKRDGRSIYDPQAWTSAVAQLRPNVSFGRLRFVSNQELISSYDLASGTDSGGAAVSIKSLTKKRADKKTSPVFRVSACGYTPASGSTTPVDPTCLLWFHEHA
jgi:hypothetical protein